MMGSPAAALDKVSRFLSASIFHGYSQVIPGKGLNGVIHQKLVVISF